MFFDIAGQTIILSPFKNFMTSSLWQDSIVGGNIYGGIMGGIIHIPPLYQQSFVLFYAATINKVNREYRIYFSRHCFEVSET